MNKDTSAVLIFSGGQDSTTCLIWALKRFKKVYAVSFNYGQRHLKEIKAAREIARILKIPLKIVKIDLFKQLTKNALTDKRIKINAGRISGITKNHGLSNQTASEYKDNKNFDLPSTFVDGRNLIFLSTAAIYAKSLGIPNLITGVCQTDYSGYPDCRNDFIKSLQKSLRLAMDYPFKIYTPLMWLTKAESVRLMRRLGGLDLLKYTWTCYEGGEKPCGKCPACKLRIRGFKEAGEEDRG